MNFNGINRTIVEPCLGQWRVYNDFTGYSRYFKTKAEAEQHLEESTND